jgi:hypothetical protein
MHKGSQCRTRLYLPDICRPSNHKMPSVILPDQAIIAYEVLGAHLIGHALPLVLVSGMSATRSDWRALAPCLAQSRPGEKFTFDLALYR